MNLNEKSENQEAKPQPPLIEGLADAEHAVFGGYATGLRPPPPIDYTAWAEQNIVFGADSPLPGKYDSRYFPFFREPLACLQPDHGCREVVILKSAQIGGTVIAQVFVGASIDQDPSPILYVHPTIDNGLRWIRTKWNPFVRQSDSLRALFSFEKTKDTSNTVFFKERRDQRGHLLVSGANSAASLSMVSFPRQVQDDLAKWENNDSGDPEGQADSRSQAYEWAKILKISTPHLEGACRITKAWKRSDQRKYHVPCPHCGHEHPLEWENFKKSLEDGMDPLKAHFTCPECGGIIEHHHKEEMVKNGRWVAADPSSRVPGFYIWSAYSPVFSWSRIAEEWFKAKDTPELEHRFMNDVVGLAYEQKGEAPPWKDIKARAGGYERGIIPAGALLLTIGVDCQGDRVEWLLKGFGPEHRRYTIEHGVIDGHISEERAQKALNALLSRKWRNVAGRYLVADMMAIDANYDTEIVMEWAKTKPESQVMAIRGARGEHVPILTPVKRERRLNGKIVPNQKRFWNIGVSALKSALYKHLEKTDPINRGFCAFPDGLDDDYFIQLCSEKRVIRQLKGGYVQITWEKIPGTRNEILDMEIYAEAAARRRGWATMSEENWENLRAERETPPPDRQLDMLEQNMIPQNAPKPAGRKVRSKGIS